MRNKLLTLMGMFALGLGLLASTTQGCGGSSGAGDLASVCNQGCATTVKCVPGLSMQECLQSCNAQASCSNVSAIVAGGQKCLGISDCAAAETCATTNIPACVTGGGGSTGGAGTSGAGSAGTNGSGNAGTSGGAGTTGNAGSGGAGGMAGVFGSGGVFGGAGVFGNGGTSGSTCDTACTKADACCKVLPNSMPANCTFKMDCDNAGANQAQAVQGCNFVLQTAALLGASEPAACK